jgi:hypothetical protein
MKRASSLVFLALLLLIPSAGLVEKYLGRFGVWAYWICGGLAFFVVMRPASLPIRLALRLKPRTTWLLVILTFVVLTAAVVVIYPIANSGIVGGGSDVDDGLNLGVRELWAGRYPYTARSYLGGPVAVMGGALLLSTPSVFLLGSSAYQNLFWLTLFFLVLKARLGDVRLALLILWLMFALAPVTVYGLLTGDDHIANTLVVVVALHWLLTTAPERRRSALLAAVLVGLGLAWRPNFLPLIPVIVMALWRSTTRREAVLYSGIMFAVLACISLPFYLSNPAGYAPLHANFNIVPFGTALAVATGLLAVGLAIWQPRPCSSSVVLRNCAIILIAPMWTLLIWQSLVYDQLVLYFDKYGLFALYFGVASLGVELLRRFSSQSSPAPPSPASPVIETPQ